MLFPIRRALQSSVALWNKPSLALVRRRLEKLEFTLKAGLD
jgi:hypothetical protein